MEKKIEACLVGDSPTSSSSKHARKSEHYLSAKSHVHSASSKETKADRQLKEIEKALEETENELEKKQDELDVKSYNRKWWQKLCRTNTLEIRRIERRVQRLKAKVEDLKKQKEARFEASILDTQGRTTNKQEKPHSAELLASLNRTSAEETKEVDVSGRVKFAGQDVEAKGKTVDVKKTTTG